MNVTFLMLWITYVHVDLALNAYFWMSSDLYHTKAVQTIKWSYRAIALYSICLCNRTDDIQKQAFNACLNEFEGGDIAEEIQNPLTRIR